MAFYIKVTREVADKLGVAGIRNSTADGNVLLWPGRCGRLSRRYGIRPAAVVGGVCLSPQQAKGEIDGVEDPVEVATPEGFMDKDGEEVTDERSE